MVRAVYPGTFDPITSGHVDIAVRAAAIFDHVVLAVYDTPAKTLLFSTAERVALARQAVEGIANITVTSFSGLTVDFARQVGAKVIVRGLRAVSDFEIELQMALFNRQMAPDLEVVCLMTSLQYSFLSATMIKEIVKLGGDVTGLVPSHVLAALRQKFGSAADPGPVPRYLNS